METPPLRVGSMPFVDGNAPFTAWGVPFANGNAAARTFGRAHRRRPYHFSCGSVSQGCRKRLRRRTKTRKGCWKRLCRWTKTRKGCRKRLRRRTKSKMIAGRGSADGLKQEKVAGRGSADGQKQEMIAGRGSADGQKRKTHPEKRISGVGFRLNMLRKWLSWRLDCEILHFFIIFAAEKIKPI